MDYIDANFADVPVILLTARAERESRKAGLQTGADDYVAKPFDVEELRIRIRNLVEQRRLLAEHYAQLEVARPGRVSSSAVGDAPGRIEVRHGWTEMGQGVHTVALQVAAQELGVDPDRIDVIVDTTRELGFGQTTGSRGRLMVAGSVSDAAAAALAVGCQVDVD